MTVVVSAAACVGGLWASDLLEVTADVSRLDGSGRWAVAIPFEGPAVCARFGRWSPVPPLPDDARWQGPAPDAWTSSLDEGGYVAAVESIRASIAAGDVYQANICRVLTADLPVTDAADVAGLHRLLAQGNPSPYGGFLRLPEQGVHLASASPELFLSVRGRGSDRLARSGPIKGTARIAEELSDKDAAENVMIVDLVRNDLGRLAVPGTVAAPRRPTLVSLPTVHHLISEVRCRLSPGWTLPGLLAAVFPAGSITGAPKRRTAEIIAAIEDRPRGLYCGAIVVLAPHGLRCSIPIRTGELDANGLCVQSGGGIVIDSDPEAERFETWAKVRAFDRR